jgi:cold shock protein
VRGKVKTLNERGFGFIKGDGGKDVFFHRSAVKGDSFDSMQVGDEVEFTCETSERGPKATSVQKA